MANVWSCRDHRFYSMNHKKKTAPKILNRLTARIFHRAYPLDFYFPSHFLRREPCTMFIYQVVKVVNIAVNQQATAKEVNEISVDLNATIGPIEYKLRLLFGESDVGSGPHADNP